jgi:N-acetylglutamate synthase-like GNAT family acetyltransferase
MRVAETLPLLAEVEMLREKYPEAHGYFTNNTAANFPERASEFASVIDSLDRRPFTESLMFLEAISQIASWYENVYTSLQPVDEMRDPVREMEKQLTNYSERTRSAMLARKAKQILVLLAPEKRFQDPVQVRHWVHKYTKELVESGDLTLPSDVDEILGAADQDVLRWWQQVMADPDEFPSVFRDREWKEGRDRRERTDRTDGMTIDGIDKDETEILALSRDYLGLYRKDGSLQGLVKKTADSSYPESSIIYGDELDRAVTGMKSSLAIQAAKEFHVFAHRDFVENLEKDYAIDFSDLSLREQTWIVQMLKSISPQEERRVIDFVKRFGIFGMRTFLSLEHGGPAMGAAILRIGERYPEKTAKKIFDAYARIADAAEKTAEELAQEFFAKDQQAINQGKVSDLLLARAKGFLQEVSREQDEKTVLDQLEQTKAEMLLFAAIFRTAFKGKKEPVSFEAIRGLELRSVSPDQISEEEKNEMLAIAKANWARLPTMIDIVTGSLKEKLAKENAQSRFYLLKKDKDLVAFCRFDDLPDGTRYAGSLNINPAVRGSAIGETMLRSVLDQEAQGHVIRAHVFPDSEVAMHYVEKSGFVISGIDDLPQKDGSMEYNFELLRDDQANGRYQTRRPDSVVKTTTYDLASERQKMIHDIRVATGQGQVVTRFFGDPVHPSLRHLAFEKRQEAKKPVSQVAQAMPGPGREASAQ